MSSILVTGATGTVGRSVTRLLHVAGHSVRVFVRDPARARDAGLPADVAYSVGDFADPASLRTAMSGIDSVYLSCGNVPDQVAHECAVIDAAEAAGVGRVVKLSARGAAKGSSVAYWDRHARIEDRLLASAMPGVLLQPSFLMSNLLAGAEQIRTTGMLFAPAAAARVAMVHPGDVAAAVVAVLTGPLRAGHRLVLTGPAAIGYDEVAAELSAVTGSTVRYLDVPAAAAREGLLQAGLPPDAADQVLAVFEVLRRGGQATATDTVLELTGRQPRTLGAYAAEHSTEFRAGGAIPRPA